MSSPPARGGGARRDPGRRVSGYNSSFHFNNPLERGQKDVRAVPSSTAPYVPSATRRAPARAGALCTCAVLSKSEALTQGDDSPRTSTHLAGEYDPAAPVAAGACQLLAAQWRRCMPNRPQLHLHACDGADFRTHPASPWSPAANFVTNGQTRSRLLSSLDPIFVSFDAMSRSTSSTPRFRRSTRRARSRVTRHSPVLVGFGDEDGLSAPGRHGIRRNARSTTGKTHPVSAHCATTLIGSSPRGFFARIN